MRYSIFEIFAGWCAVLGGIFAFLYALAALVVEPASPMLGTALAAAFLFLLGLLSSALFTGLFDRLRRGRGLGFSLWGYVLGFAASLQMMIHATGTIGVLITASGGTVPTVTPLDPALALAYGLFAAAVIVLSIVMLVGQRLPPTVAYLGFVAAAFAVVVFFTGLLAAQPASLLIMAPFIITNFLILPIWYLWTGVSLWNPPNLSPRYTARQAEA